MVDTLSLRSRLQPVLEQMEKNAAVTDAFVDKDTYRLYLSTLWSNLVLEPEELGLTVEDLETTYAILNDKAATILGGDDPIRDAFRFLSSTQGEQLMERRKITKNHRDLLTYFCSMILDPEGHKKWMEQLRQDHPRFR